MMPCNIFEHAVQQTNLERTMVGNTDVVLAAALSGQLNVRTGLTLRFVAKLPQRADQFNAIAIAWDLHGARTSIRT